MKMLLMILMLGAFVSGVLGQRESIQCVYQDYLGSLNEEFIYTNQLIEHQGMLYTLTEDGLGVYDLNSGVVPEQVGGLDPNSELIDGVVVGDHLLAISEYRLVVINIEDPGFPFIDGLLEFDGTEVASIAVHGDYAYISQRYGPGLFSVDISNIYFPMLQHTTNLGSFASDIIIDGETMYLALDSDGLAVFDLRFPLTPQQIGSLSLEVYEPEMQLMPSGQLYLNHVIDGSNESVGVIDVSDPTSPIFEGLLFREYYTEEFLRDGDEFYIESQNILYRFSIDQLDEPESAHYMRGGDSSMRMIGDRLFVAGSAGVEVISRSRDSGFPVLDASVATPDPGNFVVEGGVAYVSDTRDGYRILDVSDPTNVVELYANEVLEQGAKVVLNEHYLYVLQQYQRPLVFDVTDPTQPVNLGHLELFSESGFNSIEVFDNMLFTLESAGVMLYDISDALNPVLLSMLQTTGTVYSAASSGDYLYLATGAGGIDVFDVSVPDQPSLVLNFPTPQFARFVQVRGREVFVNAARTSGERQFFAFDFSDFDNIKQVGVYTDPHRDSLGKMMLSDDYMYMMSAGRRFRVFDVADPSDIREAGVYLGQGVFTVHEGIAYVGYYNSMTLLDVSGGCRPCPADLNGDGSLNFFDVSQFLVAYLGGDALGDWNGDGAWNFFDISGFLTDYQAGCP